MALVRACAGPELANPAPSEWARRIADARLFGAAASGAAAAPTATGDLRLLGVFAERDGKGYALFRSSARGPMLVAAGTDVAPGVRLETVLPTGVTLVDTGVRREMTLRPAAGADKPKPVVAAAVGKAANCATPPGFNGPIVRLNAELLTGMMNSPETGRGWCRRTAAGSPCAIRAAARA
jgi:hypothetical protein